MNYRVTTTSVFEKNLKKLSKKYPSLKSEYIGLVKALKEKPEQGQFFQLPIKWWNRKYFIAHLVNLWLDAPLSTSKR